MNQEHRIDAHDIRFHDIRISELERKVNDLEEKVAAATTTSDIKVTIKLNENAISKAIVNALTDLEVHRQRFG